MSSITRYILNHSDCKDPSLLTRFVTELVSMIKTDEDLKEIRNTLLSTELLPMNIRLCCFTPTHFIPTLRILGLSRAMNYLTTDIGAYDVLIKPSSFKFDDMFFGDDISAMNIAAIPYIMNILSENMPMSDTFEDVKVYLWNRLLDVATWLKDSTEILPAVVSYDEVVTTLLDICYCNNIGDDEDGERLFYDVFIGPYALLGFSRNDIPDTGSIYGKLLTDLSNIGSEVLHKINSIWLKFPHRLIIFMNLKQMMFRHTVAKDHGFTQES